MVGRTLENPDLSSHWVGDSPGIGDISVADGIMLVRGPHTDWPLGQGAHTPW